MLRPADCRSGTNSATVGERPRGGMYSYRTSRTRNPDRSPETQPNSVCGVMQPPGEPGLRLLAA